MRWKHKGRLHDITRTVRRFLWRPRYDEKNNESRWLEWATCKETYNAHLGDWILDEFIDEED